VPDLLLQLRDALADRYRVDRMLGQGGMATVYLAGDLKHDRQVAIKVLRPELAAALGPERFLREIATTASLRHPHILPLYDSGRAGEILYYVMPFVEGESLRQRLDREQRIPLQQALEIACEVAGALGYAHERGIVHRDIKPENILLERGHAVVADFGIARALSAVGAEKLTQTGLAVGTPAYMSPEQALGEADLNARSDIYSLGCVLFEMLAGAPPFRGPTPQAILARHATQPAPPFRSFGISIPARAESAVGVALAKDPAARFSSAAAFAAALSGTGRFRRPPGQRRRIGLAGLALLAVAGGWWGRRALAGIRDPRITSLVVLPLENRSGEAQAFLTAGVHEALIGELARLGALRVVSRVSALAYRDSRKPVPEIARELGVDGVLEGSVQRAGDSVMIRVALVRARPKERELWSHTYQRDLGHLVAVYPEVAREVAGVLAAAITPAERRRLTAAPAVDPQAYEAFLKGKAHWYNLTPADIDAAQRYFELALRRQPGYAAAEAGLAGIWISRLQMGLLSPDRAAPLARAAARRALELDSTLAEAHYVLALIGIQTDWDWAASDRAFRRVLELNPGHAEARAFHAHLLNIMGRQAEARAESDRALALDPINPLFLALDAVDLIRERRWADAVAQAEKSLATVPTQPVALNALWQGLQELQRYSPAADAAARYLASGGQGQAAAAVRSAYRAGGYQAAMRAGAAALVDHPAAGYASLFDVSALYLAAGDPQRGLDWLERAYQAHDPNMPYLGWPTFDPIRGQPRFDALRRRMNLPR
jgi:serine/threonine-protein kinase